MKDGQKQNQPFRSGWERTGCRENFVGSFRHRLRRRGSNFAATRNKGKQTRTREISMGSGKRISPTFHLTFQRDRAILIFGEHGSPP